MAGSVAALLFLLFGESEGLKTRLKNTPVIGPAITRVYRSIQTISEQRRQQELAYLYDNEPDSLELRIDVRSRGLQIVPFWGGFGHDQFYAFAAEPRYRAFLELVREANAERPVFRWWRAHNIFSDFDTAWGVPSGGRVYREDEQGQPVYDFSRVDAVFDAVLAAGLTPIVELGFMPRLLAADSTRKGDWGAAIVSPPRDFAAWRALVENTLRHLVRRYGLETVRTWYFEVWNEPDFIEQFWIPDPENPERADVQTYLELYRHTHAAVKSVDSQLRVGGPALAGWPYFLREFIDGLEPGQLDFLSLHRYGDVDRDILPDIRNLVKEARQRQGGRFARVPYLLDETAPITFTKEGWKSSAYTAAWYAKLIHGFLDTAHRQGRGVLPEALVYWSDIGRNFSNGDGALASSAGKDDTFVLPGPIFQVNRMLAYLGDEMLEIHGLPEFGSPTGAFASKSRNGELAIVLYRLREKNPTEDDSVRVSLTVGGLAEQKLSISHFRIDDRNSLPWPLWNAWHRPDVLTPQYKQALRERSQLARIDAPVVKTQAGVWRYRLTMPTNSVSLVLIRPAAAE